MARKIRELGSRKTNFLFIKQKRNKTKTFLVSSSEGMT